MVSQHGRSIWAGASVRIRGFEPEDSDYFARFEADSFDARNVFRITPPRSAEQHRRQAEELGTRTSDEETFAAAIELPAVGIIGAISTINVDHRAGRFMYGLAIERPHRRKGYAAEAATLLLAYMFHERRFHKCEVQIYAFNDASLGLHEKLGFRREGLLRESEYFGGRYCDVVVMGITAPEFRRSHPPGEL